MRDDRIYWIRKGLLSVLVISLFSSLVYATNCTYSINDSIETNEIGDQLIDVMACKLVDQKHNFDNNYNMGMGFFVYYLVFFIIIILLVSVSLLFNWRN